jgi:multidrug efflux pump subunit AcrB
METLKLLLACFKASMVAVVVLTALAAVLAFIPLTFSVFWGSLAYTLIGGTAAGSVLTLVFLPALYSIWFRVKPTAVRQNQEMVTAG